MITYLVNFSALKTKYFEDSALKFWKHKFLGTKISFSNIPWDFNASAKDL